MPDPAELTCRELVELVTDYLDDALPPADGARFRDHLRECDACITYIDQIRIAVALSGRLSPETIDGAARDRLLEAFRGWRTGGPGGAPAEG